MAKHTSLRLLLYAKFNLARDCRPASWLCVGMF